MKLLITISAIALITQINYAWARQECLPDAPNPSLDGQIKIAEIFPESTGNNNGWVGLKNVSGSCIDLAGWVLYDGDLEHELFITRENTEGFSDGLLFAPGSEAKVFQKGDQDFTLSSQGGKVELYSGPAEMLGELQDSVIYPEITVGESYRVIPSEGIGDVVTDDQEHIYQIPEENSVQSSVPSSFSDKTNNNEDNKKSKKKSKNSNNVAQENSFSSTLEGEVPPQAGEGFNNKTIQQSNNNPSPFIASSGLEKSPWRWFYWFWGSWFLWKIILPFLGLWAGLYCLFYIIRKKYLS